MTGKKVKQWENQEKMVGCSSKEGSISYLGGDIRVGDAHHNRGTEEVRTGGLLEGSHSRIPAKQ